MPEGTTPAAWLSEGGSRWAAAIGSTFSLWENLRHQTESQYKFRGEICLVLYCVPLRDALIKRYLRLILHWRPHSNRANFCPNYENNDRDGRLFIAADIILSLYLVLYSRFGPLVMFGAVSLSVTKCTIIKNWWHKSRKTLKWNNISITVYCFKLIF